LESDQVRASERWGFRLQRLVPQIGGILVTAQAAGEILGTERIDLAGQGNQPSIQGFDEC
jgi:hypothetical protein